MSSLEEFLAGVPVLASVHPEHLAVLAAHSTERTYARGDCVLRAGDQNRSLHLLKSGRLAVQVPRGNARDTVAHLHAGAPFGELSLITGRTCSADVRAVTEATVVSIADATLKSLPDARDHILQMLASTVAERLHASINGRSESEHTRVLLLHQSPGWAAPAAFAAALAQSLARHAGWLVLRVEFQPAPSSAPAPVDPDRVSAANVSASAGLDALVAELRARLPIWRRQYACIVLNPTIEIAASLPELAGVADWHGYLLGPGERFAHEVTARSFVVQDAAGAALHRLSGREQLIADVPAAEQAHASGAPVSGRFLRSVDSIARCVTHLQVGIALGGGGAWAWSHIGVLHALARAGLPIDAVSGCSMGRVVGALVATGHDTQDLENYAREWRRRFPGVIEYRFWRMHLARVSGVAGILREHFGDLRVNQTGIPFWPNALDIESAEEVALSDGDLVSALLASMALPAWLPPMARDSRLLIDAVFVDPVPVKLTRRMHCDFNIAVNAIGPLKARALNTRFPFRAYDFVSRCLRVVGHQLGQGQIEAAADAVLVPDLPPDTTMLSFHRYADMIAAGEQEVAARLSSILATYGELRRVAVTAGTTVTTP